MWRVFLAGALADHAVSDAVDGQWVWFVVRASISTLLLALARKRC